jgi:hypothetical protein
VHPFLHMWLNVTVDQGSNPCQGKTMLLWILYYLCICSPVHTMCFSFGVILFMCIFFLCALLCLCTPPFCCFRVCYLDVAMSLDSVVFFNNPFTLFLRYSVADISLLGNFHQRNFSADIIISDTVHKNYFKNLFF